MTPVMIAIFGMLRIGALEDMKYHDPNQRHLRPDRLFLVGARRVAQLGEQACQQLQVRRW